jgi:streptogramin lyase
MMKFKAIISIFLFLNFCPLISLQGQENYYSKTLTTENGLPHNHVYAIAQDSTGFLWIATWDGLSRYDGYEFKNYYHNPSDSNSITYFISHNLLVDYKNNLWIHNIAGISRYNRESDSFKQYRFKVTGGIALDREGKFWCNTDEGLLQWNYEQNIFETVAIEFDPFFEKLNTFYPLYIGFDNENQLLITGAGSDRYFLTRCTENGENGLKAEYIGSLDNQKYFPQLNDYALKFDFVVTPESDYWIFGNVNIFKLDRSKKEFFPVAEQTESVNDEIVRKAFLDHENYNPKLPDAKTVHQTGSYFTETYFVDNQNTLWQGVLAPGSVHTGLFRSISTNRGFKHYFTGLNPETGLIGFFPVLKDRNGAVWGGAANVNAIFMHSKNGEETRIKPFDDNTWKIASRPRAFLEDSAGVWIGYFYRLLLHYDFQSKLFSKIILKETSQEDISLPQSFIHLKKKGDEIYIASYKGIYKYNTKSLKMYLLQNYEQDPHLSLHSILRDGNTWWTGMNRSLVIQYDNDFNEIGRFVFGVGLFNIEEIIAGDNNDLWISQLGGGLVHLNTTTGKYRIYTTADGLSNNTCYGLLKDKRGNIWISTNHGISRFNPKTRKFRVFGPEDGLKIDEFNSDNTYLASDGEMFFAGMGGVVSFYPDSIDIEAGNQYAAPLLITDFRVSGDSRYFQKAIYETNSVELKKGDNNFRISFACLDFVNAQKIKYRYRLQGEDDNFTETDYRNRTVNYNNLLPGNYHLDIEATNANGEWVAKTELFVKIPPYYYQTWWFRVLIVFLVAAIIGYFIFTHNRQLMLKARQQQDELKLESLRGQMNPHFIFNSLNSINYFISQNDRLAANRYIADFARLIRSILGNLSHEYIPLAKELESLNDYLQLEHLRFSDKFDYEISVDAAILPDNFLVFPGMVQPFIENAIWHGVRGLEGRKGFVKIRFFTENTGSLCCVVEDDGIGRKQSEAHKSTLPGKTSRGIGIVMERLKIINHLRNTEFKVTIEDLNPGEKETGTQVIVDIPVKLASPTLHVRGYITDLN